MTEHRDFKVFLLGITDADEQALLRILRIAAGTGRSRSYSITKDSEPEPGKIFIVNSDNAAAVRRWLTMNASAGTTSKIPTIFASKSVAKCESGYHIGLPFRATPVFSTLDSITVKELNYIPELTIGREDNEDEEFDDASIPQQTLETLIREGDKSDARYTVMVVDDSPPVRKQLELELKLLGARVEMAENGEQAMEMSQDKIYDMIFLDVVMPGIDGYKVCKAIKRNSRTKNTPVIMLTGKSSPFDKVKGTLAGCDTYLTKPLQHDDFQTIAKKYLLPA